MADRIPLIATEEAFATPEYIDAFRRVAHSSPSTGVRYAALFLEKDGMADRLCDVGTRLADMDASGIDMHLMSLVSPGVQIFEPGVGTTLAAQINDRMAELIREHPARLSGLAAVAPQDPIGAAAEIDRAINVLGLNGVIINSHTGGEFLDEPKYCPLLEAAEKHGAPIYIHPTFPPDGMLAHYEPYGIHGAIWGFAAEAGLHAVRLVLGGVFDRFPGLQIVLGHMGEGLPYFLFRLDNIYKMLKSQRHQPPGMVNLKRNPSEYVRSNIHITTSGMFWEEVLQFALKVMGAERIIFAVDYPFESSRVAREFVDRASITAAQRAMIMSGNARKLFRIRPQQAQTSEKVSR